MKPQTKGSMNVLYFGNIETPGHYLYDEKGRRGDESIIPWRDIDTTLCPPGVNQKEGVSKLHHKDGWTALAFWDRSGDSRGNSNSVFFAEGEHTFSQMVKIARNHFGQLFERFTFPIEREPEAP